MWRKIERLEDLSQAFADADSHLNTKKTDKSEEIKMQKKENNENQKNETSEKRHEKISPINMSILIASVMLVCLSIVMFFL